DFFQFGSQTHHHSRQGSVRRCDGCARWGKNFHKLRIEGRSEERKRPACDSTKVASRQLALLWGGLVLRIQQSGGGGNHFAAQFIAASAIRPFHTLPARLYGRGR